MACSWVLCPVCPFPALASWSAFITNRTMFTRTGVIEVDGITPSSVIVVQASGFYATEFKLGQNDVYEFYSRYSGPRDTFLLWSTNVVTLPLRRQQKLWGPPITMPLHL